MNLDYFGDLSFGAIKTDYITLIQGIGINFCIDTHVTQRMNPNDFVIHFHHEGDICDLKCLNKCWISTQNSADCVDCVCKQNSHDFSCSTIMESHF